MTLWEFRQWLESAVQVWMVGAALAAAAAGLMLVYVLDRRGRRKP